MDSTLLLTAMRAMAAKVKNTYKVIIPASLLAIIAIFIAIFGSRPGPQPNPDLTEMPIKNCKESNIADKTTGISKQDFPQFIYWLKDSVRLQHFSDDFGQIMQQMGDQCNDKGTYQTIYGDLDEKTTIYGVFHCIEDTDYTFSVTFTIHTLSFEFTRENVQPGIHNKEGVMEKGHFVSRKILNYLVRLAKNKLNRMGISELVSLDTD